MSIIKEMAFFKSRPTSSMPMRKSAIQCVRACSECIRHDHEVDLDESILSIRSFDNVLARKFPWFEAYQSVQYHMGQFEILQQYLKAHPNKLALYVVAATRPSDLRFLDMVMKHVNLPKHDREIVIMPLTSCVRSKGLSDNDATGNFDFEHSQITNVAPKNPLIVPISITKDHDNTSKLLGLGSVCVQLLEPYPLKAYKPPATTFIKHLYSDLTLNSIILPTHLVAFIILYLYEDEPVSISDLITYMNWIRRSSIDLDMQIGFTGNSEDAVEFGLLILKDFIQSLPIPSMKDLVPSFRPKNYAALFDYANMVSPFIAHQGILGKAILMTHNEISSQKVERFEPSVRYRVTVESVRERSYLLAEMLECSQPVHKPCTSSRSKMDSILDKMQTFGHYFRIEEPKIMSRQSRPWGDDNSDDEYFQRNSSNPALKSWLIVTDDKKKLDRLNLFVNAINDYL